MKILYVIGSLEVGGAEKQLVGLAQELKYLGHDVTIATLSSSKKLEHINVPLLPLNLRFYKNPLLAIINLPKFINNIKSQKYDVVQAVLPESVMIAIPIVKFFSPKTLRIASVRGVLIRKKYLIFRMYKQSLKLSDLILCNANHLQEVIENEYGIFNRKIVVINNAVTIPTSPLIHSRPTKKIAVIANFHTYKRHDLILLSISKIVYPFEIIFIGSGTTKNRIMDLAESLGLKNKVHFAGSVDPVLYLGECSFAIHSSTSEGFSNAILEELAWGLPVIASDILANKEIVIDNVNGLIFESNNEQSLTQKIELLLNNDDLLQKLASNTRKSIQRYSWSHVAQQHVETYYDNLKTHR